jgi:predicted phosphodiesterase
MSFRIVCALGAMLSLICGFAGAQPVAPDSTRNVPWTHLQFNNDPAHFQFAIIADRTGGMRAGVFEKGVDRLNLLQPEFVVSVGDLISGYTEDEERMDAEWDEFDRIAARFQMPFFYVAGNHDITNPRMAPKWRERYGPAYHHFVYKGVLFLLLNSEDPKYNIGEEQTRYISHALESNPDVRWTLVFIHRPPWDRGSDKNGWNQVVDLLGDRPYTVFAGHTHRYLNEERNGMQYYVLATTGGSSRLEGVEAGRFDHVTWVTMSDQGPVIANLLLDGILPGDIRTEYTRALTDPLFRRQAVLTGPLFTKGTKYKGGNTTIRFRNPGDLPLKATARFLIHEDFRPNPRSFDLTVPPGEEREVGVSVRIEKTRKLVDLAPLYLDWALEYDLPDRDPLEVDGRNQLVPEQLLNVSRIRRVPAIDGRLDDWKSLPIGGPNEGCPAFSVVYDDEYLYLAVRTDEKSDPPRRKYKKGIRICLDARSDPDRSLSQSGRDGALDLRLRPDETFPYPGYRGADPPEGLKAICVSAENGMAAEVRVPLAYLDNLQGGGWEAVRLNVAVHCYGPDAWRGTKEWWRPDWQSAETYAGSGTFLRK